MGRWQKSTERWLSNEEQGLDDAADAAFQQVFSALPLVEPSSNFVQRAVDTAWRARARQRRILLVATVAASLFVVLTVGAAVYGVLGIAGGWLLTTGAAIVINAAVSIILPRQRRWNGGLRPRVRAARLRESWRRPRAPWCCLRSALSVSRRFTCCSGSCVQRLASAGRERCAFELVVVSAF